MILEIAVTLPMRCSSVVSCLSSKHPVGAVVLQRFQIQTVTKRWVVDRPTPPSASVVGRHLASEGPGHSITPGPPAHFSLSPRGTLSLVNLPLQVQVQVQVELGFLTLEDLTLP